MGSVENEQNCWRYYGVAHWRQEHTVQWRVSTCSQWKVKPASCWFYPINDLSGFDTFISFPLSNLLGELRWAVMLEKMLEPSVLAGKEESDCFPFFWISLWNASRKEMWEGNSYWGRKDNKHPLHCKLSLSPPPFSLPLRLVERSRWTSHAAWCLRADIPLRQQIQPLQEKPIHLRKWAITLAASYGRSEQSRKT